jgi:hypothetical protein
MSETADVVSDWGRVSGCFSSLILDGCGGRDLKECAVGELGTVSSSRGDGSSDMDGKGGRKSGICSGGSQFDERGRFRIGDEGFDIGERGRGGEDCLEGGLLCRRGVILGGISSSIV